MKITIVGAEYVGLSNAIFLARDNDVYAFDVSSKRVDMINEKTYLEDKDIQKYLKQKHINLTATTDAELAYRNASFVLISTPTNYNDKTNSLDTSSIESAIKLSIKYNSTATIVVRSTVPIGFTESVCKKYNYNNILFVPEFMSEGHALHDSFYPSRIIVGMPQNSDNVKIKAKEFIELLTKGAIKENIPCFFTHFAEAEAIKLFSNAYLALRVAYFNEIDTYAEIYGLNTKQIIDGVGLDERIGLHYNNPSFGYGGYCLPKDTKQLLTEYKDIPNNIINAIVKANATRKTFIEKRILECNPKRIGIYRLIMKTNSDNFRQSAIQDIIESLRKKCKEEFR